MDETLYFYDLETSGINPRDARIMQFAGQRTDLELNPIGEPDNILVRLTNDILPEPQAILITGITPQETLADGISEREFAKYFIDKIATPNTTILGYNTVRFDNEFVRFLMYRNFYDAYEWSYKNGISTWDLLDLVRITRALRPDGIQWPFAPDGKASNRLELLTAVNKISHEDAHDALSDVRATIALAKLIKQKQPKLYEYLFKMRSKQEVARLVGSGEPFIYTSGRYSTDTQKTKIVIKIADHPVYSNARALVYDLNVNPTEFFTLTSEDLLERMKYVIDRDENTPARLPVKELTYNKCPAIAPLGVLDQKAQENTKLDLENVKKNLKLLKKDPTFVDRVVTAFENNQKAKQQDMLIDNQAVDSLLYDGFFNDGDRRLMGQVRKSSAEELADLHPNFADDRLVYLLELYKARQLPASLSEEEQAKWEEYRRIKLMAGDNESKMAKYMQTINNIATKTTDEKTHSILQDLILWAESIAPVSEDY